MLNTLEVLLLRSGGHINILIMLYVTIAGKASIAETELRAATAKALADAEWAVKQAERHGLK